MAEQTFIMIKPDGVQRGLVCFLLSQPLFLFVEFEPCLWNFRIDAQILSIFSVSSGPLSKFPIFRFFFYVSFNSSNFVLIWTKISEIMCWIWRLVHALYLILVILFQVGDIISRFEKKGFYLKGNSLIHNRILTFSDENMFGLNPVLLFLIDEIKTLASIVLFGICLSYLYRNY